MIDLTMFRPTVTLHRLLILREIYRDPKASMRSIARAVGLSATAVSCYLAGFHIDRIIGIRGKTNRSMRYSLTARGELYLADYENQLEDDVRALKKAAKGDRA